MDGSKRRRWWPLRGLGALGLLGSVACSGAMTAALLGIGGTAAAGAAAMGDMAGMSDPQPSVGPLASLVGFLIWAGPAILLLSLIALVAATVGRRPAAGGIVLAAGALLYWGMYLQSGPELMVASIVIGLYGYCGHLRLVHRLTRRHDTTATLGTQGGGRWSRAWGRGGRPRYLATVRDELGPVAVIGQVTFVDLLPKTRSGKIMRRVLKAVVAGVDPGDISTIEDEGSVEEARQAVAGLQAGIADAGAGTPA